MKLVILDRDGVINEDSEAYIKSPAEWLPITGSLEAVVRLKHAGYTVVVATNQSGIGRGLFGYDELFAIHDKMHRMLAELGAAIDGVFFCPHAPDAGCRCRKPDTGLLDAISNRLGVTLDGVPLIGDSITDMQAACSVGARPVLVLTGHGSEVDPAWIENTPRYPDLASAVDTILKAT